MKTKFILLLTALLSSLFCLYGCTTVQGEPNEIERTVLETPVIQITEENVISCQAIENAAGYEIEYIYEDENRVTTQKVSELPYELPLYDAGVYSVRMRALAQSESEYYRSQWSDYVQVISVHKSKITTPQNLKGDKTTIKWGNIKGCTGYELDINGERIVVESNSYTSDKLLPGTEYKIRVRALIEENIYTQSSDWSKEYLHSYTVVFNKPTNLARNAAGVLTWSGEATTTGYTVSYKTKEQTEYTNVVVYKPSFDMATLPDGEYSVKVMVNGIGSNPGSDYTEEKKVRITRCYMWNASDIVSTFTSWEGCTLSLKDGKALMHAGSNSWGGIISPDVTINYTRNPVLVIDYSKVNYGYMGKYITPDLRDYYYVGDTGFTGENVTMSFVMSKYVLGSMPNINGTQNGIKVLVGYVMAPESNGIVVSELNAIYIAYVEDVI